MQNTRILGRLKRNEAAFCNCTISNLTSNRSNDRRGKCNGNKPDHKFLILPDPAGTGP